MLRYTERTGLMWEFWNLFQKFNIQGPFCSFNSDYLDSSYSIGKYCFWHCNCICVFCLAFGVLYTSPAESFFKNWNVVKIWIKKLNDVTLTVKDTGSKLVSCFRLLFLILMFFNKVESIQWDPERHFWIVCFQKALNTFTCTASSAFVPFACTTQNQKAVEDHQMYIKIDHCIKAYD